MTQRSRVLIIVAVFAALSCSIIPIGHPSSPALREVGKIPRGVDIAIVGDSRAHAGISPAAIASTIQSLGEPKPTIFNFAVDGTDVLHHYSLIANGLAKLPSPPRLVIWAPNPLEFNDGRSNNRLEQLLPRDVPAMLRAGAPSEIVFDVMAMWLFPPWRHRTQIALMSTDHVARLGRRSLPYQARLLGLKIEAEPPLSRRYIEQPDGQVPFVVLDWEDRFRRGELSYEEDYQDLKLSRWRFAMARLLARKVRSFGGRLLILEMPVSPYYQTHFATRPQHLEWRKEMARIAGEEGADFWDDSRMFSDDRMFGDPAHMPQETARLYSISIAQRIGATRHLRLALKAGEAPPEI